MQVVVHSDGGVTSPWVREAVEAAIADARVGAEVAAAPGHAAALRRRSG